MVLECTSRPLQRIHHVLPSFNQDLCRGRKCLLVSSSPAAAKNATIFSSCIHPSGAYKSVLKLPVTSSSAPQGRWMYRNAVTVAVQIKKTCVNINKGRGYVVVYRSKIRQLYCEYKDNIKCDVMVVRYSLPSCLLIGKTIFA